MISIFTDRETATILSALRFRQKHYGFYDDDLLDIATNGGAFDQMVPKEIDALCERINFRQPELELLDHLIDQLRELVLYHIIDDIVREPDGIRIEVRGWEEPFIIPLGAAGEQY